MKFSIWKVLGIFLLCVFQGLLQTCPNSTVADAVAVMAGERLSDRVVRYNVRRRTGDLAAGTAVPDSVSVFSQKQAHSSFTGHCLTIVSFSLGFSLQR